MSNLDFSKQELPFELPQKFFNFLCSQIVQDGLTTVNLRDSTYSDTGGGFRPVEILVEKKGNHAFLHYVTEFAYFGTGYCVELGKSIDFDFSLGIFTTHCLPSSPTDTLENTAEFFELHSNNFVDYVSIGLLDTVKVTTSKEHLAL